MESDGDLAQQLGTFLLTHPVQHVDSYRHRWEYYVGGAGADVVVLLPGVGGKAEEMFAVLTALEGDFRVIAISYPDEFVHVPDLTYAISLILDIEVVPSACFLGHSLGGMFAECYMLEYPERTNGLILANVAHFGTFHETIVRAIAAIAPFLPREWVDHLCTTALHRQLRGSGGEAFWAPYLTEVLTSFSKKGFESRLEAVVDVLPKYPTKKLDIDTWKRRVLIIESDNDPIFTAPEREALRLLYSQAVSHVIPGAGHLSLYTRPEEFVAVVHSFLTQYI